MRKIISSFIVLLLLFSVNTRDLQGESMENLPSPYLSVVNMQITILDDAILLCFDLAGSIHEQGNYYVWANGNQILGGTAFDGDHLCFTISKSQLGTPNYRPNGDCTYFIECGARGQDNVMRKDGCVVVVDGCRLRQGGGGTTTPDGPT